MHPLRRSIPLLFLLLPLLTLTVAAQGREAIHLRLLVVTGSQAAGLPEGVVYRDFSEIEQNDRGQIVFRADLAGPGVGATDDDAADFLITQRGVELLDRDGDPAAGLAAGVVYVGHGCASCAIPPRAGPRLDARGVTLFVSKLRQSLPVAVVGPDAGLFIRDEDGTRPLLVANGQAATPGLDRVLRSIGVPVLGDNGRLAVEVTLLSPNGDVHGGLVAGTPDALRLAAEAGTLLPTKGEMLVLGPLHLDGMDRLGQVAFRTMLMQPDASDPGIAALVAERHGALRVLFATGDAQAIGQPQGVLLDDFGPVTVNGSGRLAFVAALAGAGVGFGENDLALLSNRSGHWETVAQLGDAPADALQQRYSGFSNPLLGDRGQVLFTAFLDGDPGARDGNRAIFLDTGAELRRIATEGAPAAGFNDGITYLSLARSPSLNQRSQVMFQARLAGLDVDHTNDQALYLTGRDGRARLLFRTGDPLVLPSGGVATITWVGFAALNPQRPSPAKVLNNRGNVICLLRLQDGPGHKALVVASQSR